MANDFNAQTTIDRRTMATIAKYLQDKGADIRSLSDLTRMALESFAVVLIEKLGAEEITSSNMATDILGRLTYGQALYNSRRFGASFMANVFEDRNEEVTSLPKSRGRQPKWDENDAARMWSVAEKAISNYQKKQLTDGEDK